MVTDKERREVAARLRGLDYADLQESLICAYLDALGIKGYEDWVGIAHRLADLIEPSEQKVKCVAEVDVDGERLEQLVHGAAVELTGIDRDALIELADEIRALNENAEIHLFNTVRVSDTTLLAIERRIREAVGA